MLKSNLSSCVESIYAIKTICHQIENLEELLKEKDNQVDIARTKLSAVQAQTFSSEGTVTSLEEALADRDKQINQLREQRDRAEKDNKEEKVNAVNLNLNVY